MATWLQRAFNKSGTDDPFIIGLLKGVTQAPRNLGQSFLLPAYELSNQLNRVTDKDKETKWNYDPLGNQTFMGAMGRNALSAATGGGSNVFSALLNQLGVENRLAPEYNWTPEARQMATQNSLLDTQEREAFVENPEQVSNRMMGQVALGMAGAGLNPAIAGKSFIPRVTSRFALGAPQGILGAELNKGESPLLSGMFGGLLNVGFGEAGDLLSGQNIDYGKLKNTEDINKLPARQKNLLTKQAKNSGFWNTDFSDEKNILTFLDNRDLAGKIPQESLYKIENEIDTQKGLRTEALGGIPEITGDLVDPIKQDALGRLTKQSGMSADTAMKTSAWKQISSWIDEGNFDADSVDNAISNWQKSARTMSGSMKDSNNAQVFNAFATSLKDVLRGKGAMADDVASKIPAVGQFDESVSSLDKLFGFQDEFGKSITQASSKSNKASIPIPGMLGGPRVPVSKLGQEVMRAGSKMANVAEQGLSSSPAAQFIGNMAPVAGTRLGSGMTPGYGAPAQQSSPEQGQTGQPIGQPMGEPVGQPQAPLGGEQPGQPGRNLILEELQRQSGGQSQGGLLGGQEQGPQQQFDMERFSQDLMQAVLAGQISPTQAEYAMSLAQNMAGGQSITDQIAQLAQTDPEAAQQLLGQAVISGQIDSTTAKTYAGLMGMGEDTGKLSMGALNAKSGWEDLQTVNDILDGGNKGVSATSLFPKQLGDPQMQKLDSAVRNIVDIIARTRTGAAMNLKEEELYNDFAPTPWDTEENRKYKLGQLDRMFRYVMENEGVDTSTLGTENSGNSIVDDYNFN